MSKHLLAISIGPVQDFIAAARRTRDLWFGSHVLSEISKAAARALQEAGATLIFPAPDSDLTPDSPLSVANKILAELPDALDARALSSTARNAAGDRWLEFAQHARKLAGAAVRDDIWKDQIEDVIEFYAAWAPLNGDYKTCRERVERLLAGRKALRDFLPAKGRAEIPKSSLDGARESVLSDPQKMGREARAKARLKDSEQLDAVGLVKRLAGNPDTQFVSVSRIAADPWVRHVARHPGGRGKLDQMAELCHADFASAISDPTFSAFKKEGTVLYASRLDALMRDKDMDVHREHLKLIKTLLGQISSELRFGEPSPYLAILVADGDRMGAALSEIGSADEHRTFSRQLSQFAEEAGTIVAEHRGCLIYSGGDDVLAFLPLDTCLNAARALHDQFETIMANAAPVHLTLSVGLAIGHCMEALEDLLDMGRTAERAAKSPDRDGLAVHLTTRGADATTVRAQWTDAPDKRLNDWADLLIGDQLPDKLAYDLRQMAQEYTGWTRDISELLKADVHRLLKKKRSAEKPLPPERIELLLKNIKTPADLAQLASELIIARHLAESMALSRKNESPSVEKTP